MPELFDCHCHLHAEVFDADRDVVIARARAAGVRAVLAVAEDLEDCWRVLDVASRHPGFVVPALGIHPDRAPEVTDAEVAEVTALIRRFAPRLGAVGEVGLDHRPCWDERARARQADVLREMVRCARELGLPLSVHSRQAGRAAVELLLEEDARKACLHAFDGRAVFGERGAEAGLRFSIPPSVVRSRVKQKLVPRLPEEALLLESDSPVLGPDPAARNEPANLRVGLAFVAHLRGRPPEELAARIHANTADLFPRLAGPGSEGRKESPSGPS